MSATVKSRSGRRRVRSPEVRRIRRPGLDAVIVSRDTISEFHITVQPLAGETNQVMLWRVDRFLREHDAVVLRQDVFGASDEYASVLASMRRVFGECRWPVTWVEGESCDQGRIAGMHLFAISGPTAYPILSGDRVIGTTFEDGWARYAILGDVRSVDPLSAPTDQVTEVFAEMERALWQTGMTLSNLVRTWLFIDRILEWYDAFNAVRTEIFTQRNLFANGVPASTGVGTRNPFGSALVAGAWATQPLDSPMQIAPVVSPLQCSAQRYGSSFSRAMEITAPGHRRVFVSGTASIAADGRTAHPESTSAQIALTMQVVDAILRSRQLSWANVTRATAYFAEPKDAKFFQAWAAQSNVALPILVTRADICRSDLLFEIESDALQLTAPVRRNAPRSVSPS